MSGMTQKHSKIHTHVHILLLWNSFDYLMDDLTVCGQRWLSSYLVKEKNVFPKRFCDQMTMIHWNAEGWQRATNWNSKTENLLRHINFNDINTQFKVTLFSLITEQTQYWRNKGVKMNNNNSKKKPLKLSKFFNID